jgi:chaperonin GroEL (HSP60 family)
MLTLSCPCTVTAATAAAACCCFCDVTLQAAEPLLERHMHPTVLVRGYTRALEDAVKVRFKAGKQATSKQTSKQASSSTAASS